MLVWNIYLLLNISYKPGVSIQAKDEEIWYMNVFWKDTRHVCSYWPQALQKENRLKKKKKILTYNWKKRKIFGAWVKREKTQAESFRRKEIRRERESVPVSSRLF